MSGAGSGSTRRPVLRDVQVDRRLDVRRRHDVLFVSSPSGIALFGSTIAWLCSPSMFWFGAVDLDR